jgi:hypothetical protein
MSARLTGRKRRLAVAVGVVTLLAMAATAYAAIPNDDGNIYACYSNGDGSVRVHEDPAKVCPKRWSPLKWSAGQPDVPVTTTYRKAAQTSVDSGFGKQVEVPCEEGDVATGGGFSVTSVFDVLTSAPSIDADGWVVDVVNSRAADARTFNAYVVCQHTE